MSGHSIWMARLSFGEIDHLDDRFTKLLPR
jgi:hypothetical protein